MEDRRPTFSKYIIDERRRAGPDGGELAALLNDVQTACKHINVAVAQGALRSVGVVLAEQKNADGDVQKPIDLFANELILTGCEWGGQLSGMVSEELDEPYVISNMFTRGRYLLVFDPLDGSSNVDVNMTVGTIFSILEAPDGIAEPRSEHFLQPGHKQVAAGYALYGPASMLVITIGNGVHGFTLDPEIGAYTLTHPHMCVPETTQEFAINASNERFWEPPVQRYVEECVAGKSGDRVMDFNMRWIASLVAEVHRILIRGGVFLYPRDTRESSKPGRLRLLYEANPMAMLIEQAGGAASTGRERLLDVQPTHIHQRVGVVLGSKQEVERIVRYHAAYDRGEDVKFATPLFNRRSLFRTA